MKKRSEFFVQSHTQHTSHVICKIPGFLYEPISLKEINGQERINLIVNSTFHDWFSQLPIEKSIQMNGIKVEKVSEKIIEVEAENRFKITISQTPTYYVAFGEKEKKNLIPALNWVMGNHNPQNIPPFLYEQNTLKISRKNITFIHLVSTQFFLNWFNNFPQGTTISFDGYNLYKDDLNTLTVMDSSKKIEFQIQRGNARFLACLMPEVDINQEVKVEEEKTSLITRIDNLMEHCRARPIQKNHLFHDNTKIENQNRCQHIGLRIITIPKTIKGNLLTIRFTVGDFFQKWMENLAIKSTFGEFEIEKHASGYIHINRGEGTPGIELVNQGDHYLMHNNNKTISKNEMLTMLEAISLKANEAGMQARGFSL